MKKHFITNMDRNTLLIAWGVGPSINANRMTVIRGGCLHFCIGTPGSPQQCCCCNNTPRKCKVCVEGGKDAARS